MKSALRSVTAPALAPMAATPPPTPPPAAGPVYGAVLALVGSLLALTFAIVRAASGDEPLSEAAISTHVLTITGAVWTIFANRRAAISAAVASVSAVGPILLVLFIVAIGGGCGAAYYEGQRQEVVIVDDTANNAGCVTRVTVDGREVLTTRSATCPPPVVEVTP